MPAVDIRTSDPVVIENSSIRGKGHLVKGFNNRLTIRNTTGYGLNPNVAGKTFGDFLHLEQIKNLVAENNYIESTHGIYLNLFTGDPSAGETVKILRNQFKNIDGRISDGNGLTKRSSFAHAIIFNTLKSLPNLEIAWNEIVNEPGKSFTEENIIMYGTSGTSGSPIKIHDNYIQGGYSPNPESDISYAGGGILLGDGPSSNNGSNANVYNNQIVSTTNQGLAISGGVNHKIYNNRVVSSGLLPNGKPIPAQNVGIYVWDINGAAKLSPPTFGRNEMSNNVIMWTKVKSDGSSFNNPMWLPSCGINGTVCNNNRSLGKATLAMEKNEYNFWKDKLKANNVSIGVD